ncbi:MAG: hypothetical protein JO031_18375 [Ktedonobacteraceae bacterium]|nr:hypothetical protein [Ktedonobacteraceae bacterium]
MYSGRNNTDEPCALHASTCKEVSPVTFFVQIVADPCKTFLPDGRCGIRSISELEHLFSEVAANQGGTTGAPLVPQQDEGFFIHSFIQYPDFQYPDFSILKRIEKE